MTKPAADDGPYENLKLPGDESDPVRRAMNAFMRYAYRDAGGGGCIAVADHPGLKLVQELDLTPARRAEMILLAVEHVEWLWSDEAKKRDTAADHRMRYALALADLVELQTLRPPSFTAAQTATLVRVYAEDRLSRALSPAKLLAAARRAIEKEGLTEDLRKSLVKLKDRLLRWGRPDAKLIDAVDKLLGAPDEGTAQVGAGEGGIEPPRPNPLQSGEAWSDAARDFVSGQDSPRRTAWVQLFQHGIDTTGSAPPATWSKVAAALLDPIGRDEFRAAAEAWLPLLDKPRTGPVRMPWGTYGDDVEWVISDRNVLALRGLVWCCTLAHSPEIVRALGRVVESSLKKLAGLGPRLPKLANAAIYALGRIAESDENALGQLARLKTRVSFKPALKQIEKALDAAAQRLGTTKEELEELAVPAYGFGPGGSRVEVVGDARCELRIDGGDVVATWTNDKGKPVKSPPAAARAGHADALKALKAAAADAGKMLTAQRERLDRLMGVPKTWRLSEWRQRYLDHPLVGAVARRLIWTVDGVPVTFGADGRAGDVGGKGVEAGQTAEVALWHPAGREVAEVVAWRRRLQDLGITQPFKQAHREVYVLTDAERNTRTYSNRFAAHVLRQHQFHALCAARGWDDKLRLMVDDDFPPASKELPAFGMRAEFWVEGIGDNYGTDTNDTGTFLRLASDQVRFYRQDAPHHAAHAGGGGYTRRRGIAGPAEPLALEDVPPLAFSEVMRDVDLFVGVASVGNDPAWQDGGPEGRYRDYWASYSFGELSATARTRREVLAGLLPRLKIRDRASLADRFLVVRGDLRTYKIHLGSGNILMEPNDQYLCIVPNRSASAASGADGGGPLFLPFEGDATLSLVLSKAFLLADDTKIKDPTIVSQIGRR